MPIWQRKEGRYVRKIVDTSGIADRLAVYAINTALMNHAFSQQPELVVEKIKLVHGSRVQREYQSHIKLWDSKGTRLVAEVSVEKQVDDWEIARVRIYKLHELGVYWTTIHVDWFQYPDGGTYPQTGETVDRAYPEIQGQSIL